MSGDWWLFFVTVLAVVALPGVDMAFVVGSAMAGGRRQGLAAVLGIMAGSVLHTVAGVAGAAAMRLLPASIFAVMLAVSGAYIAWLGLSILRSAWRSRRSFEEPVAHEVRSSEYSTFARAALTNLLNPKAYAFSLAVYPRFVSAERGPLWAQGVALGVIVLSTQFAVYGAAAWLVSGAGARWGSASLKAQVTGVLGGALVAAGVASMVSAV